MADAKMIRIVATNRIRHSGREYKAGQEFDVDEKSYTRLVDDLGYAVRATSKEGRAAVKEAEAAADEVATPEPTPAKSASKGARK